VGLPAAGRAQRLPSEDTTVLGPLAGRLATPAFGQWLSGTRFAPDLGLTAIHEGQLRIIFGDAIVVRNGAPIGLARDDVQGEISLEDFPNGAAVDAYVAANPPAEGEPFWQRETPPVTYRLNWLRGAAAILAYVGGGGGRLLNTGLFKAPVAAFSNAMAGEDSAFFTIYARWVPMQCSGGETPSCDQGFECEPRLGQLGETLFEDSPPCVIGSEYCSEVAGGGLCFDPTSSLDDADSLPDRARAVVWAQAVGNADPVRIERYYTRQWFTNKFVNLSARTVNDFDEARIEGQGNDYRPADGTSPDASKVFLWGRPAYIGTGANGQDLRLYFAVADMPRYSATGEFEWAPRYFTGMSTRGVPQFSSDQREARALDLGAEPVAEREIRDVVNQMSISWVDSLASWVMLYGGGTNEQLAEVLTQGRGALVEHDPDGAIQVRFASQPWGPWSAPQPLLRAGSPHPLTEMPEASSQYGPGGILRHPLCTSRACAPHEPTLDDDDYGFLYGVNLIDAWTQPTDEGAVLYWNVSTWHPYQVLLMRSEAIRAADPDEPEAPEPADEAPAGGAGGDEAPEPAAAGGFADGDGNRPDDAQDWPSERRHPPSIPSVEPAAPTHSGCECRVAEGGSRSPWSAIAGLLLALRVRRTRRRRARERAHGSRS